MKNCHFKAKKPAAFVKQKAWDDVPLVVLDRRSFD